MSAEVITAHFAKFDSPKRETLEEMRKRILEIVPEAEQTIKYNMPTFTMNGKAFACLDGFKNHLGYFPYSGQITKQVAEELKAVGYKFSDGGIQFKIDEPIAMPLLKKLIALRLREIAESGR
ncbi:MAG: iron chaperone [Micrococcales bacterium]